MTRFALALSLILNGALAGLIAGHLRSLPPDGCSCRRCRCAEAVVDPGPFPTGWVVPDAGPKPKGDAP